MTADPAALLHAVPDRDGTPLARLLSDLPIGWRSEAVGPEIEGWAGRVQNGGNPVLDTRGLPRRLGVEIAWMAHWQFRDGVQVTVSTYNQLAQTLTWAADTGRPMPPSLIAATREDLPRLHRIWFHQRYGRLPPMSGGHTRLEAAVGYPRPALRARLNEGPWWELDTWHPRCDPRIPQREHEPVASAGCPPGAIGLPWVRNAVKWHLSVLLESGALTWSTLAGQRVSSLRRFGRWLDTLAEPAAGIRDLSQAGPLAASFRHRTAEAANRSGVHRPPETVSVRKVNLDLGAVAGLMAFLVDNRPEAARILGPSPWDGLTEAHPGIRLRQRSRLRRQAPVVDEAHYIDDHALAQIAACLPALGEPGTGTITIGSGTGRRTLVGGGDPQLMRILLLQILTGRRASEICLGCSSSEGRR